MFCIPKQALSMQNYKQITLQLEQATLDLLREQSQREGDRPVASLIREILQQELMCKKPADNPQSE